MVQPVVIRKAVPQDVPVLVSFNCAIALETENKRLMPDIVAAGIRHLIAHADLGFYIVAERGNEIAGALMVTTEWSDWRNGIFWWIQNVYVRPDCRRQGIYRQLYQQLQSWAEEDPAVCGFRLYVEKENFIAQQTYKSLGMEETPYWIFEALKAGDKLP